VRLLCRKAAYVAAALKQPSLFTQSPAKINGNIAGAADLLGVKKAAYVAAALKQPSLFYQSPVTINANIEGAAGLLGVKKAAYVAATLKQPSLFSQSPVTIYNHGRLMRLFNVRGIIEPDVDVYFLKQPLLLTLADSNFKLRLAYAHFAGRREEERYSLLSEKRGKIEKALVEVMVHDPAETMVNRNGGFSSDKRHHQLERMIETGLIKGYKLEPV